LKNKETDFKDSIICYFNKFVEVTHLSSDCKLCHQSKTLSQTQIQKLYYWTMASTTTKKVLLPLFYNDFYAINHNGTKMCHGIVHFLEEMLLCGGGFLGE